jgi:hypothetical protein
MHATQNKSRRRSEPTPGLRSNTIGTLAGDLAAWGYHAPGGPFYLHKGALASPLDTLNGGASLSPKITQAPLTGNTNLKPSGPA